MKTLQLEPTSTYAVPLPTVDRPIRALASAMLSRAVGDLGERMQGVAQSTLRQRRESYESALKWLERGETFPMSFSWCCRVLGLEVERTRKKILAALPVTSVHRDETALRG